MAWSPSKTQTYQPSSGQTYDIAIPSGQRVVRVYAFIKPSGGANTDCFLRINAAKTNISSRLLNNGVDGASPFSSLGLCRNGGVLRIDMTILPATASARRTIQFSSESLDSAGVIQTNWVGSLRWDDTSTAMASFGFDLDTGMAFSSGSYITVAQE